MTRHPGRDEQGRPIVAELGRAETPGETAERRAKASAERRGGMNATNLLIALAASLGIVALMVMVVVRPDAEPQYSFAVTDYAERTAEAAEQLGVELVTPTVPDDWFVNRVGFGDDAGVTSWEVVFITSEEQRLMLVQTADANPTWVADVTGRDEIANVIEGDGITAVIVGTANARELALLSDAVERELAE